MKSFFMYATICDLDENHKAPYIRGTGRKTYLYFSATPRNVQDARSVIPGYERIVTTRIYYNKYPTLRPQYSLEEITALFSNCQRCNLANYRWRTVTMRGLIGPKARIVMVGQSPGRKEDMDGRCFVGPSGSLLAEILSMAKWKHPFILDNIVSCRPNDGPGCAPRNDPRASECVACSPRLWMTLCAVRPNIVLALGQVPAKMFWENPKKQPMNKLVRLSPKLYVGQVRHPAYLLRRMSAGSDYEYEEAVEFFRKLSIFLPTIEPYTDNEDWKLNDDAYPFKYITKEVKL